MVHKEDSLENKTRIAVLSGGWSKERVISLKSGKAIFDALDKSKYDVLVYDPREDLQLLWNIRHDVDLALILLHGRYGEDGRIQGLLDHFQIPFMGSGVLASAMAMNKRVTKDVYRSIGLPVPKDVVLRKPESFSLENIKKQLGTPVVVKPVCEGSSLGISIMETDSDILAGIEKAFEYDLEILLEEYLAGREITCAVLGRQNTDTLPLVEIVPQGDHRFFDFDAKYIPGETTELCPAPISSDLAAVACGLAQKAHRGLQCRDWSRTDMILCDENFYILETNTIPGMTETSLVPLAARGRGWNLSQLLDYMIDTCLAEPDY